MGIGTNTYCNKLFPTIYDLPKAKITISIQQNVKLLVLKHCDFLKWIDWTDLGSQEILIQRTCIWNLISNKFS